VTTAAPRTHGDSRRPADPLKVTTYDRVSGLLVALIVVVGLFVAILFFVWLSKSIVIVRSAPVVQIIDEPMGRGDNPAGVGRDFEEPGSEELADVTEPQLAETLEAVTSAVSSNVATLEALEGTAPVMGTGKGKGDSRVAGEGGEGNADIIPRWERWEIRYTTSDVKAYAAQLDFFRVELAAVGGGRPLVDYASNLSLPKPNTRSGPSKDEKRLRLTWTSGVLKSFDEQLLRQAGIETNRRLVMQFYPPEAENALAAIETREMTAKKKNLTEIKKTVFGVRPGGGKYEFHLISQEYRAAP
jgi:hypothetical protein